MSPSGGCSKLPLESTSVVTPETGLELGTNGDNLLKEDGEEESWGCNEVELIANGENLDVEEAYEEKGNSEDSQDSGESCKNNNNDVENQPEIIEENDVEKNDNDTFNEQEGSCGDDDLCSLEDDEEESVWFDESRDNNSEPAAESLSSFEEQECAESGLFKPDEAMEAGSGDPIYSEDGHTNEEPVPSSLLGGVDESSDDDDLIIVTEIAASDVVLDAA